MIRSTSCGSGRPVAAHIVGNPEAGVIPGMVLISLTLGEAHLRAVLAEYQAHYNSARPHQGIAQRVPDAGRGAPRAAMTDLDIERIRRKPVLKGLINE
jgi:transposase InsO family protein